MVVIEGILDTYRDRVDVRLSELLPSSTEIPETLHEAMRYSALAPGKRIRPAMCMASALALGAERWTALDAGCAIELVHCFSLIHDDLPVIDNDDLRRGRPTCHVKFGEAMAILAGDAMFALAFEIASESCRDLGSNARVVKTLSRSSGSKGLVGGEVLDVISEGSVGNFGLLQTIHNRKTGSLIGASCEIGAIVAGADEDTAQKFYLFGEQVGLAFQIADDVLNETSTPEQLGKATGSDRDSEKLTYPALVGLEKSKILADECLESALSILDDLGLESHELQELAKFAVNRTW